MSKQFDISKKVEKALESLEGLQRAEPAPFFFTRVRARLDRDEKNVWEVMGGFLARPVVAFAGLFLILGLNAAVLFQKDTSRAGTEMATFQNPAEESILTASNSFDYENLEP